jgi:hypothetical protein
VVQFLCVYVREAHPIDGVLPERQTGTWLMQGPERELLVEAPETRAEREALARRCQESTGFEFPVLVDELDDAVEAAYAAWPERLYLVDVDGSLVYRGAKGPLGFSPDEFGAVLAELAAFYRAE